jgi:hypothetical protein
VTQGASCFLLRRAEAEEIPLERIFDSLEHRGKDRGTGNREQGTGAGAGDTDKRDKGTGEGDRERGNREQRTGTGISESNCLKKGANRQILPITLYF